MTTGGQVAAAELRGVTKRYGATVAVDHVDVAFWPGEIVGLVGKNGAGKSTLIKMLAGAVQPDDGRIFVKGKPVQLRRPHDATRLGLSFVHQELALVPKLSVAENVSLGLGFDKRLGLLNRRQIRQSARGHLQRLGVDADPAAPVASLSIAMQRMVMVARGLAARASVLVLDEPTAALTQQETDQLHDVLRALAADGVSIIYVSHRVEEILALTHRVDVMRDGDLVESRPTSGLDRSMLVTSISGTSGSNRAVESNHPTTVVGPGASGRELLSAAHLAVVPGVEDASLTVHAGEVLGIAGLVGSGRTELARVLFGADHATGGTMSVDGRPVRFRSTRDALRAGVVLVPEDRKSQGAIMDFSVAKNISLPSIRRHRLLPWLPLPSRAKENAASRDLIGKLTIAARDPSQKVSTLSGGNQQKVILAKWLLHGGRVFILDEPTIGIDVGAKREVFALIRNLVGADTAALIISSDFTELVDNCDRVVVMREGRTVAEVAHDELSEAALLEHCYGAATTV